VEVYEAQVEIVREQVRRLAEDRYGVQAGTEIDELQAALQVLQMTGTLEKPVEQLTYVRQ
jgi:outer membrane protein TolC